MSLFLNDYTQIDISRVFRLSVKNEVLSPMVKALQIYIGA